MAMSLSTRARPVVGIISEYFVDSTTIDKLAKLCPAASIVEIDHTAISAEHLQNLEILIADPTIICDWLSHLPKLKWMQSTFAGVNAVFEKLPQDKPPPSFLLTKLGGVFGPVIAEYVVGQIIARERNFELCRRYQEFKEWCFWRKLIYRELSELTIGILGFGDIGQEIARYCKSMRMTVLSIHRKVPATKLSYVDESFCVDDLHQCLKRCDYLCSVLPSTPSTVRLLSEDVLQNCKEKKTVLINVGRGDVVSNDSILKALDSEWIGGAILDVFEEEPLSKDSRLWTHPQVTITPHCSGLTGLDQVIKIFLENFELYQAGKPMKYVTDWSKGY